MLRPREAQGSFWSDLDDLVFWAAVLAPTATVMLVVLLLLGVELLQAAGIAVAGGVIVTTLVREGIY